MEKQACTITVLTEFDWQILKELTLEMGRLESRAFSFDSSNLYEMENSDWADELRTGYCQYYVAFAQDMPIGMISAAQYRENGETYVQIADFYVRQAYRGNGIGQLLIRECFELAARNNASTMRLTVNIENNRARNLYERLGFRSYKPPRIFNNRRVEQEELVRELSFDSPYS